MEKEKEENKEEEEAEETRAQVITPPGGKGREAGVIVSRGRGESKNRRGREERSAAASLAVPGAFLPLIYNYL